MSKSFVIQEDISNPVENSTDSNLLMYQEKVCVNMSPHVDHPKNGQPDHHFQRILWGTWTVCLLDVQHLSVP